MTYYSTYQTHSDSLGSNETVAVPTYGAGCRRFCTAPLHALLRRACGTLSQIWPLSIAFLQVKRSGLSATALMDEHGGSDSLPAPGPAAEGTAGVLSGPLGPRASREEVQMIVLGTEVPGRTWRPYAHEWRGHAVRSAQPTAASFALWLQILKRPQVRIAPLSPVNQLYWGKQ